MRMKSCYKCFLNIFQCSIRFSTFILHLLILEEEGKEKMICMLSCISAIERFMNAASQNVSNLLFYIYCLLHTNIFKRFRAPYGRACMCKFKHISPIIHQICPFVEFTLSNISICYKEVHSSLDLRVIKISPQQRLLC